MQYDELSKRLMVVDGVVPRDFILSLYRERDSTLQDFNEALETIRFWQRAAAVSALLMLSLMVTTLVAVGATIRQEGRLAQLDLTCVDASTTASMLSLTERVSGVNDACISLHEKNRGLYEVMTATQGDCLPPKRETVEVITAKYVGGN